MKLSIKTGHPHIPGHEAEKKNDHPTAEDVATGPTLSGYRSYYIRGGINFDVLAGNTLFPNFKEEINV